MLNEVDDHLDEWMPDECQVCQTGPFDLMGEIDCGACALLCVIEEPWVRPQR